jgi:predicted nuclease with TOPRIM domain
MPPNLDDLCSEMLQKQEAKIEALQEHNVKLIDDLFSERKEVIRLEKQIEELRVRLEETRQLYIKELALQRLSDIGQAIEQEPLYTHPEKTLNFFEISIDDKYVIRIYKSGIYESELGNLSAKMPIEEWNEHAKNVKEILKKAS